jgi:putative tricarboxylic transport membrane protein
MEFLNNLVLGFSEALTLTNLAFCLLGALLGTLIGVLPGIGPTATIAVLLPITFFLPPLDFHPEVSRLFHREVSHL